MRLPTSDEFYRACERAGLSRLEASILLGVHTSTIDKWMLGGEKPLPKPRTTFAVSQILAFCELGVMEETAAQKIGRTLQRLIQERGVQAARKKILELCPVE